jgi:hypothetical protein
MAEPAVAAQLSNALSRLLGTCERAVADLSVEEMHDTHGGTANCIAFDVWHVARTADNVVHFVFEREQPVWLSGGFQEKWGLPRVAQGTGMDVEEAYSMRFPEAAELCRYVRAVSDAIVPRVAAMSEEYLASLVRIAPWGEIPRVEAILQVLIGHGNGHLGRCDLARTLIGKPGLGF